MVMLNQLKNHGKYINIEVEAKRYVTKLKNKEIENKKAFCIENFFIIIHKKNNEKTITEFK